MSNRCPWCPSLISPARLQSHAVATHTGREPTRWHCSDCRFACASFHAFLEHCRRLGHDPSRAELRVDEEAVRDLLQLAKDAVNSSSVVPKSEPGSTHSNSDIILEVSESESPSYISPPSKREIPSEEEQPTRAMELTLDEEWENEPVSRVEADANRSSNPMALDNGPERTNTVMKRSETEIAMNQSTAELVVNRNDETITRTNAMMEQRKTLSRIEQLNMLRRPQNAINTTHSAIVMGEETAVNRSGPPPNRSEIPQRTDMVTEPINEPMSTTDERPDNSCRPWHDVIDDLSPTERLRVEEGLLILRQGIRDRKDVRFIGWAIRKVQFLILLSELKTWATTFEEEAELGGIHIIRYAQLLYSLKKGEEVIPSRDHWTNQPAFQKDRSRHHISSIDGNYQLLYSHRELQLRAVMRGRVLSAMNESHNAVFAGKHPPKNRFKVPTLEHLNTHFYWPTIGSDLDVFLTRHCPVCRHIPKRTCYRNLNHLSLQKEHTLKEPASESLQA